MTVAGIDLSSFAVDIVLIDEDSDAASWHRVPLHGQDAFDRSRSVRDAMPGSSLWDDVVACGIEQPRGHHGTVHIARVQGAVLACLPNRLLVQPWNPSAWRKTVGLPGNASKADITRHVMFDIDEHHSRITWPQDACDAYCIAYATRTLLERGKAAA